MKYEQQIESILENWLNEHNGHKHSVNFLVEWLLEDKYFTMGSLTENNKLKLINMLNGD